MGLVNTKQIHIILLSYGLFHMLSERDLLTTPNNVKDFYKFLLYYFQYPLYIF